ncbi:endoglucanase [Bacillus mesophilus]|uniref:Glycoside hydrolase family 5 protein n=1 Tax=Bacillus mesophilus TaxID=1808955 RepID=A0A6M0Q7R2_9BACI|nr:glycoside hydrolase family 5 protein [Bacillus mesophilus]MBM7661702.1 endoglucanase [Bacillus mesophilus]NEY72364.1 glycoside hydrolase family 5 protein [Bacillus mesophilus]
MKSAIAIGTSIFIIFLVAFLLLGSWQEKPSFVPLRSINIGNALDAPKDIQWDVEMKKEYFSLIQEAGFNAVRLPIRFSDYAKESVDYKLDEEFMDEIDLYIEEALKHDLRIILDLHHFEEIMLHPEDNHELFLSIWEQLSTRYQDYSDDVIFELLNEPKENLNGEQWNQYIKDALAIIRQTNPSRKVIVGPGHYNSLDYLKALELPEDPHLIVTFHYYEPNDFAFQGNPYHQGFEDLHGIEWNAEDEEVDYIKRRFTIVKEWADARNLPVYLGEFGINKEAPYESRIRWTAIVRQQAEEHGFSWGYWELASSFGIYDPKTGEWDQRMLDALLSTND